MDENKEKAKTQLMTILEEFSFISVWNRDRRWDECVRFCGKEAIFFSLIIKGWIISGEIAFVQDVFHTRTDTCGCS